MEEEMEIKKLGVSVTLSPKQGALGLLLLISLVFAGDWLRSSWAGTAVRTESIITKQNSLLAAKMDTLSSRLDAVAFLALENKEGLETIETEMLKRIDQKQDSIEDVVKLVGRNLQEMLEPIVEASLARTSQNSN